MKQSLNVTRTLRNNTFAAQSGRETAQVYDNDWTRAATAATNCLRRDMLVAIMTLLLLMFASL